MIAWLAVIESSSLCAVATWALSRSLFDTDPTWNMAFTRRSSSRARLSAPVATSKSLIACTTE